MINDFLKVVAENLRSRFNNDLSKVIVVFPNKRANLFFNEYLIASDEDVIWAPRYFSISDFFGMLSKRSLVDPIDAVCRLYSHYIAHTGSNESLDFFYGWGEQLLADFDDADKNMAPIDKLFRDVKDYVDLESSDFLSSDQLTMLKRFSESFRSDKLTTVQANFKNLWSKAYDIYQDLNNDLKSDNLAYEGALYREVVENLEQGSDEWLNDFECVAFVGFNAIDKVEEKLFTFLMQKKKALFYWDYDTWYIDNKSSEAGLFLRENLLKFPNAINKDAEEFNNLMLNRENRSIEFVSSATDVAQAHCVAEWLEKKAVDSNGHVGDRINYNPQHAHRTAIVLCNENLLLPTLQALPDCVESVNVTKGYPFAHTHIYASVVKQLQELYNEVSASGNEHKESTGKYNLEVLNRLQEYVKVQAHNLQDDSAENGLDSVLYSESYFLAYTIVNRFVSLIESGRLIVSFATLERLMKQVMRTQSIPFHGEPIKGLQVMGVLETRCLDFDNVLMLSVNEGILPQKSADSSFIPYLIRKIYGLTTADRRVAVYAYYFYRLIQRVKHLRLVYNNSTDGLSKGEISRFMRALQIEASKNMHINYATLQSVPLQKPSTFVLNEKQQTKDTPLFSELSPSALKTYMKCPRQFYYHYIKKLRTPQIMDPIINANDFGTIFHNVAENIYGKKVLGQGRDYITYDCLKKFTQGDNFSLTLDSQIIQAFKSHPEIASSTIIKQAIKKYLTKLLMHDKQYLEKSNAVVEKFKVIGAEIQVSLLLDIPFRDSSVSFKIYGNIDRVDEVIDSSGNVRYRIIDYKTGKKKEKSNYSLDSFFTQSSDYPDNALQIFAYSLIWCTPGMQTNPTIPQISFGVPVQPMLYYIPSLSAPNFTPNIVVEKNEVYDFNMIADDFKKKLIELISEIIDPNNDFAQTSISDNCKYCDYKQLCGKD